MNVQIIINVTVMVYSKHMNNMIEDLIEVMVRCQTIVEQSRSREINCSEKFQPQGSSSVTKTSLT